MPSPTFFSPPLPLNRPPQSPSQTSIKPRHPLASLSLIRTFTPLPFIPFPFSNSHFQTIFSHFYPTPPESHLTRIQLPSDDLEATLNLDIAYSESLPPFSTPLHSTWEKVPDHSPPHSYQHLPHSDPVVVVLHGLESNSRAVTSQRITLAMKPLQVKVVLINYRSCASADDIPTTEKLYHAGFTEDLETVLRAIRESAIQTGFHPPQIFLCGFSLGANVALTFLGQQGRNAHSRYGIVASAVACVPFDPTACQKELDEGWKGWFYSSRLVSTMHRKFKKAVQNGVAFESINLENVYNADRVGKIDQAYIAPTFGFKDKEDYYQKVDARKILKKIAVPTLIINSYDDPFFDHMSGLSLPTPEQIGNAPILLNITKHGGHCGFLDKDGFFGNSPGYFQTEFARFFTHIRDARLCNSASDGTTTPVNDDLDNASDRANL